MNPIFSRRYKGGSRPNIMPTSRRQQGHFKSLGSSGTSTSSSSSGSTLDSAEGGEDALPAVDEGVKSPMSDHEDSLAKGSGKEGITSPGDKDSSSRLLAHQLLQSKQNMLAQMSLTADENRERTKPITQKSSEDFKPFLGFTGLLSPDGLGRSMSIKSAVGTKISCRPAVHEIGPVHPIGGDMTFQDLEFDDQTDNSKPGCSTSMTHSTCCEGAVGYTPPPSLMNLRVSIPNLNQNISKETLDLKTWRELKRVVNGATGFHEGWKEQGFVFDSNIPFGLVQHKGGPCGVLAVVQSLLIRNLLFGSTYSPIMKKHPEGFMQGKLYEISSFLTFGEKDESVVERIQKERVQCLVDAVAEILWGCGQQRKSESQGKDGDRCIIMLNDTSRIQPEMIRVNGKMELQQFLQNSLHKFDCIALVYSAVMTRGINGVKSDMDFENCSLIGQHGYCSQELINLLSLGKATSNVFDNEIELEGKLLKGICAQCDIGLLSLFEHYDSIKVGSFLKCPRYPVWIVCSESHFSVLFSCEPSLCMQDECTAQPSSFDLFYYDGLSRQEEIIRLSIRVPRSTTDWHENLCQTNPLFGDEELIPPLEKCIRTKWKGADVDWNETEPIL